MAWWRPMMLTGLLAQAAAPGPDPEPWAGYLLAGLGVVVLYLATRVDTDSTGRHRHAVTRALCVLGALILLGALVAGVDAYA